MFKVFFNSQLKSNKDLILIIMDESLELLIGEFNYLFGRENNPFLTLGNLYTTHEEVLGIDTVGSIVLELGNISNKDLSITSVTMLSQSAKVNQAYVKPVLDVPNMDDNVSDILGLTYTFDHFEDRRLSIDVRPSNSTTLLLPISYVDTITHIERFALEIIYTDQYQEYHMIIDDFPFIIRSPFDSQYEHTWVYHDFSN